MLKPSIFQLFLVAIPSPAKAGEICVIVDTELFAVGAACNLFHIRVRMAPTRPVCQPFICHFFWTGKICLSYLFTEMNVNRNKTE